MAIGAVFTTLHFLQNLWTGPVIQSATSYQTGKAFLGQKFKHIGSIHKLQRKSVLRIWLQGMYSQHFIFFVTYEWTNKLQCYITLGWKGFPGTKTLGPFVIYKEIQCCKYGSWGCIHNTSFSSELTDRPSNLEYYITLGWKGFPGTKIQAYWVHS